MPINLFWEIEKLLKRIDYMIASNEDAVLIAQQYQKVYAKVAKYAVTEKDRISLYEKIHAGS